MVFKKGTMCRTWPQELKICQAWIGLKFIKDNLSTIPPQFRSYNDMLQQDQPCTRFSKKPLHFDVAIVKLSLDYVRLWKFFVWNWTKSTKRYSNHNDWERQSKKVGLQWSFKCWNVFFLLRETEWTFVSSTNVYQVVCFTEAYIIVLYIQPYCSICTCTPS